MQMPSCSSPRMTSLLFSTRTISMLVEMPSALRTVRWSRAGPLKPDATYEYLLFPCGLCGLCVGQEARAPRADRYAHRRRDSRRRVQELSHDDAQRLQPADQLRDEGESVGVAECGEAEAASGEVANRYNPGASMVA